jgi:hypothetical protein
VKAVTNIMDADMFGLENFELQKFTSLVHVCRDSITVTLEFFMHERLTSLLRDKIACRSYSRKKTSS